MGTPAKATLLLVGLHYLKHAFSESDESLVARWVENPYWQSFCGFTTMQHELPLHPTTMTKWRKRGGADKLAMLLQETIALALRERQVSPQELQQVNVDTTVQEKSIAYQPPQLGAGGHTLPRQPVRRPHPGDDAGSGGTQ